MHSLHPSTLNLSVAGSDLLVALCGPGGSIYPHAVALERAEAFGAWGLGPGSLGSVDREVLRIRRPQGEVLIDLSGAAWLPHEEMPAIGAAANARQACATRLAERQADLNCALRMDPGYGSGPPLAPWSKGLHDSASRLAQGVSVAFGRLSGRRRQSGAVHGAIKDAAAALVGLGPGLTPAGDDFLCGFLAAARAGREGAPGAGESFELLKEAVAERLSSTGEVSASLLRAAMQGFWPVPLMQLAEALASDRTPEAVEAMDRLCLLGHSSGADMATGFLLGLDALRRVRPQPPKKGRRPRGAHGGAYPPTPQPAPPGPYFSGV